MDLSESPAPPPQNLPLIIPPDSFLPHPLPPHFESTNPISPDDLPNDHYKAVDTLRTLLAQGFSNDPDAPPNVTPRSIWLRLTSELLSLTHSSIKTSLGNVFLKDVFADLSNEESLALQLFSNTASSLKAFLQADSREPAPWKICLRCMEQCNVPLDQANWESILLTCGQHTRAAQETIINDAVRSLSKEVTSWTDRQREFAQDSAINRIISDEAPLHLLLDPRLVEWVDRTRTRIREHVRAGILQELSPDTVDTWAAPAISETVEAVRRRASADAQAAYSTHFESLRAAAIANAEQEFENFKRTTLRIEMEERKEAARMAAINYLPSSTSKNSIRASRKARRADPMSRPTRSASRASSDAQSDDSPTTPKAALRAELVPSRAPTEPAEPSQSFPPPSAGFQAAILMANTDNLEALTYPNLSAIEFQGPPNTPATTPAQRGPPANSVEQVMLDTVTPTAQNPSPSPAIESGPPENSFEQAIMTVDAIPNPPPARTYPSRPTAGLDDLIARQLTTALGPIADTLKAINSRLDKLESYDDPFANIPPDEDVYAQMDYDQPPDTLDQDELDIPLDEIEDAAQASLSNLFHAVIDPKGDPTMDGCRPDDIDLFSAVLADFKYKHRIFTPPADFSPFMTEEIARAYWQAVTDRHHERLFRARRGPSASASLPPDPPSRLAQPPIAPFSLPSPAPLSDDESAEWTVIGPRKGKGKGPGKVSFADAVANNTPKPPSPKPLPPTPAQAAAGLSREQLQSMTKSAIVAAFKLRFDTSVRVQAATKEGLIEAYLARAAKLTTPSMSQTKPPPPKVLQSTEYTVIRPPSATAGSQPRAADIVRTLQKAMLLAFPGTDGPPVQVLAGRWSTQTSPNFVLTLAGQPSHTAVAQVKHILCKPFGKGCLLAPQRGYTRVLLNRVPIIRTLSGALPGADTLMQELGYNPVCRNLPTLSPPRWLTAKMKPDAVYGSITFAILDEDGSRLKAILQNPPSLFGEIVRPKKFNSLPAIRQCTRCWRLGHMVGMCPRRKETLVCRLCAGAHDIADHGLKCPNKSSHKRAGLCNCPVSCFNCKAARLPHAGHSVTDLACPLRKKFRPEPRPNASALEPELPPTDDMVEDNSDEVPPEPMPQPTPITQPSAIFSSEEALLVESLTSLSDDTIRALPSVFLNDDMKHRILASRK